MHYAIAVQPCERASPNPGLARRGVPAPAPPRMAGSAPSYQAP